MEENGEKCPSQVVSSNCLMCVTNSPELKDIRFTMTLKQKKAANLHIWKAEATKYLAFHLKNT